jgi:hypothetical protein
MDRCEKKYVQPHQKESDTSSRSTLLSIVISFQIKSLNEIDSNCNHKVLNDLHRNSLVTPNTVAKASTSFSFTKSCLTPVTLTSNPKSIQCVINRQTLSCVEVNGDDGI